jgi:hypothetical protein
MRYVVLLVLAAGALSCSSLDPTCPGDTVDIQGGGCDCPSGTRRVHRESAECVEDPETGNSGTGDGGGSGDASAVTSRRDASSSTRSVDSGASEPEAVLDARTPQDSAHPNDDDGGAAPDVRDSAPSNPDVPVADAASPTADGPSACVPAAEVCDGKDQDCDGVADNGLKNACGAPCGQVVPMEDCGTPADDNCDGKANEGCTPPPPSCIPVAEVCDGKDQDCDGVPDNGVKNACGTCGSVPAEVCDGRDNDCDGMPDDGVKNACGTCGDVPAEVCDGKDNDCDGRVDEDGQSTWYRDCDGDGYAASATGSVEACAEPARASGCTGWTKRSPSASSAQDCDDADAKRHPGATFGTIVAGRTGDLNCDGRTETRLEFVESDDRRESSAKNYRLCGDGGQTDCTGCYSSTAIHVGYRGIGQEPTDSKFPFISYFEGTPPCADGPATVLFVYPMTYECGIVEQPTIILRNLCR